MIERLVLLGLLATLAVCFAIFVMVVQAVQ